MIAPQRDGMIALRQRGGNQELEFGAEQPDAVGAALIDRMAAGAAAEHGFALLDGCLLEREFVRFAPAEQSIVTVAG